MIEAPVRLSANGEYGFPIPDENSKSKIRVTVNGDSKRLVFAYDMEEGWADVVRMDDNGKVVMHDGGFMFSREYGKVVAIILP